MEMLESLFDNFPLQVLQTIIIALFLSSVVYIGRETVKQGSNFGKAIAGFGGNIGSVVGEAVSSVTEIASYNPFRFIWNAVVWVLFILCMIAKFIAPIAAGYFAFSAIFSGVENADFRSIFILPGVIMGALMSFRGGRKLIAWIGIFFFCVPAVGYVAVIAFLNLTYWLTIPFVAISAIFFKISLTDYIDRLVEQSGAFAEATLNWWGLGFWELFDQVSVVASPPLWGPVIYICAGLALLISWSFFCFPVLYAYLNVFPGKLKETQENRARDKRLAFYARFKAR